MQIIHVLLALSYPVGLAFALRSSEPWAPRMRMGLEFRVLKPKPHVTEYKIAQAFGFRV